MRRREVIELLNTPELIKNNHEHIFKYAITLNNEYAFDFLLDKVDHGYDKNTFLITICEFGRRKFLRKLLKRRDVNPSDRNNEALYFLAKNPNNAEILEMAEMLILDLRFRYREDLREDPMEIFKDIIIRRKMEDRYFGRYTENFENPKIFLEDPVGVLKYVMENESDDPEYYDEIVDYIFSCFDNYYFSLVLDSKLSDDILISLFKKVKTMYINYDILFDYKNKRNINKLFLSIPMNKTLIDTIINHKNEEGLIESIKEKNFNLEDTLRLYRKTSIMKYDINRDYNLVDIVLRKNRIMMYAHMLNGEKIQYFDKNADKKFLEERCIKQEDLLDFTERELSFMKKYFYDEDHREYIEELSELMKDELKWYIYDESYSKLNEKLRREEDLDSFEMSKYMNLNNIILKAPMAKKECILYRGIKVEENECDVGDKEFIWSSFISCSPIKEIAENYTKKKNYCLYVILVPKRAITLNTISLKNTEDEVILPPNSIFKKIRNNENGTILIKYSGYVNMEGEKILF